ncbi:hypothetical protein GLA29479_1497 [Lysobacter antibioticus]|nr:hypothetical protein GLA29479_1497 [Lysobacter antibioticus]
MIGTDGATQRFNIKISASLPHSKRDGDGIDAIDATGRVRPACRVSRLVP